MGESAESLDTGAREPQGRPDVRARQPWLHDLSTVVNGNITVCSAADGQISAPPGQPSAQGLYVDDRRVLAVLTLRLEGEAPIGIASRCAGARGEFWAAARNLGDSTPDPTVEIRRHRELVEDGLIEGLEVISRASKPVTARLLLEVGGDGADISAVKAGLPAGVPLTTSWSASQGLSWGDERHRTTIVFSVAPDEVAPAGSGALAQLAFQIVVDPGESWTLRARLHVQRSMASNLDAGAGSTAAQWCDLFCAGQDPQLAPTVRTNLEDLRRLLLTDPEDPHDIFTAAGTPWYLTLFGRDSLWSGSMMLPFGTDLAAGTLRTLARRQGRRTNAERAEEPGKIPHEVRRSAGVSARNGAPVLPEVYYGTIDATPLWVSLLHDAWSWGMDEQVVDALAAPLVAATQWMIESSASDPDGLLRYIDDAGTGLANQGWKDSSDAIRWRDGRVAHGPIALVEAQAYAVEAAGKGAVLMDHLGIGDSAALRQWREAMIDTIRDRFWVNGADERYLGLALDGEGRLVDGLASNMGHVLGTGALSAHEADDVARMVSDARLLGRYGLATLARDNGGFNPIGYHTGSVWTHDTAICARGLLREGHRQQAAAVGQSLLASAEAFDYRWPELYADDGVLGWPAPYPAACRPQAWAAASAAVLVDLALGFAPDAQHRRLVLHPLCPAPFGAFRLEGLRFRGERFGVDCAADGTLRLLDPPQSCSVDIEYAGTRRAQRADQLS